MKHKNLIEKKLKGGSPQYIGPYKILETLKFEGINFKGSKETEKQFMDEAGI